MSKTAHESMNTIGMLGMQDMVRPEMSMITKTHSMHRLYVIIKPAPKTTVKTTFLMTAAEIIWTKENALIFA